MVDGNPGKGDGPREGFNKKKHDEGYVRAFYTCTNNNCPSRYKCFRWLRTPTFKGNHKKFVPDGDKCEFFVPDRKEE